MPIKNFGFWSIINCTNTDIKFHTITELAYKKCHIKKILKAYTYLERKCAGSNANRPGPYVKQYLRVNRPLIE
ncbi:hypothetical protein C2G38_2181215 [Gigaspora rosea]|uniref:Uncharacterized protein n=1 Tax=Gigaspora rosea TaxID=44941 RepID=A0A397VCW0_9GLOM|nr:hypothetical protein C2G38_2181215 [Gigaspora rosea]